MRRNEKISADPYKKFDIFCKLGNNIFFAFSFGDIREHCHYDDSSNILTFVKRDPHTEYLYQPDIPTNIPGVRTPSPAYLPPQTTFLPGFVNDIDEGLPFWPAENVSIQNNQQLVGIYSPIRLNEMLTEEYFSAHNIKNIQTHKRLKNLLKNINEDDNPVLMIATFK